MNELGNLIREKRREYNFTQADLAEKVDVTTGYIGTLEIGKQTPGHKTLFRIATVLNIPVEQAASLGLKPLLDEIQKLRVEKEGNLKEFEKLPNKVQNKLLEMAELLE